MDRYFSIDLSLYVPSSDKNVYRGSGSSCSLTDKYFVHHSFFTLLSNAVCPDLVKWFPNVAACTGYTAVQPLLLAGSALHFPEGTVCYRQGRPSSSQHKLSLKRQPDKIFLLYFSHHESANFSNACSSTDFFLLHFAVKKSHKSGY